MGGSVTVPQSHYIQGGIKEGTDVVVHGLPNRYCKKFTISLCTGPTPDQSNVALSFDVRFDEGVISRNHKEKGCWGEEETHGDNPIRRGQIFVLHIKAHRHAYTITVNKKHFCDFNHRMAMHRVNYFCIEAIEGWDITINYIEFSGEDHQLHHQHLPQIQLEAATYSDEASPSSEQKAASLPPALRYPYRPGYTPQHTNRPGYGDGQPSSSPPPDYDDAVAPILNPAVPVITPIPGGFYPGKMIYIAGIPYQSARRFYVNLALDISESSALGLHFDVRFRFQGDKNIVVRTHRRESNHRYSSEERFQDYFPFQPGVPFEILILGDTHNIKVAVNNRHFIDFNHRIKPMELIDHLQIDGDVVIAEIKFQ